MSISTLIASGAANALALIKQFVTNPTIGGVTVRATRFECVMEAEVSRKLLINLQANSTGQGQQGLQNVFDNVAPGPRTWDVEGYVGGLPFELTSLYMPSLDFMTQRLDSIFNGRQATVLLAPSPTFGTLRTYNVLISRYSYRSDPNTANRAIVKLSLVEVTFYKVGIGPAGSTPALQANASPVAGGVSGAAADAGSTAAQASALPAGVSGGIH